MLWAECRDWSRIAGRLAARRSRHQRYLPRLVADIHAAGYPVLAYTVNEPARARYCSAGAHFRFYRCTDIMLGRRRSSSDGARQEHALEIAHSPGFSEVLPLVEGAFSVSERRVPRGRRRRRRRALTASTPGRPILQISRRTFRRARGRAGHVAASIRRGRTALNVRAVSTSMCRGWRRPPSRRTGFEGARLIHGVAGAGSRTRSPRSARVGGVTYPIVSSARASAPCARAY